MRTRTTAWTAPWLAAALVLTLAPAVEARAGGRADAEAAERMRRHVQARREALPPDAVWAHVEPSRGADALTVSEKASVPEMLRDLSAPSEDAGDPRRVVAAVRAVIESTWDVDLPEPPAPQASSHEGDTSVARVVSGGGDLTGDGLEDVLVQDFVYDVYDPPSYLSPNFELPKLRSFEVRALRGTDGGVVWEREIVGPDDGLELVDVLVLPASDMTGDGADDIVVMSFWHHDAFFVGVDRSRWDLEVVSGLDGSTRWSRRYFLEIVRLRYYIVYRGTHVVVPMVAGDHDGDGASDLVINTFDQEWTSAGYAWVITSSVSRSEVLAGHDGSVLYARTDEGSDPGILEPAGHAVGGPGEDLFWRSLRWLPPTGAFPAVCFFGCELVYGRRFDFEMVDGDTFETVWRNAIESEAILKFIRSLRYTWMSPVNADLTGDGADDLLLDTFDSEGDFEGGIIGAVSGSDGGLVWRGPGEADGTNVAGPVGGGPGEDIIQLEVGYDASTISATLRRIDGATGVTLFETEHSAAVPEGGYADVFLSAVGDGDGDAVLDIIVDLAVCNCEEDFETERSVVVESGVSGASIWSRAGSEEFYVDPAGDGDGDGTDDVIVPEYADSARSTTLTARSVRLPSGDVDWTFQESLGTPFFGMSPVPTADQTGDGGDDLLLDWYVEVYDSAGSFTVLRHIDSLSGADGTVGWGFGDDLPSPPDIEGGTISGTVVDDAGAPTVYLCVDAYPTSDPDTLAGRGVTFPDGSYEIDGLDTASYKVFFYECDGLDSLPSPRLYEWEWYESKPDFDSADPVAVTDGIETPGIDVVLQRVPPPENDDRADAIVISALPFEDRRRTGPATLEPGEPTCERIEATVWYSFTPTPDMAGLLAADTLGSDFDTVLAVYLGQAPTGSNRLGCSDEYRDDSTSRVVFPAVAGQTYWIQAGGYFGWGGNLKLTLSRVL